MKIKNENSHASLTKARSELNELKAAAMVQREESRKFLEEARRERAVLKKRLSSTNLQSKKEVDILQKKLSESNEKVNEIAAKFHQSVKDAKMEVKIRESDLKKESNAVAAQHAQLRKLEQKLKSVTLQHKVMVHEMEDKYDREISAKQAQLQKHRKLLHDSAVKQAERLKEEKNRQEILTEKLKEKARILAAVEQEQTKRAAKEAERKRLEKERIHRESRRHLVDKRRQTLDKHFAKRVSFTMKEATTEKNEALKRAEAAEKRMNEVILAEKQNAARLEQLENQLSKHQALLRRKSEEHATELRRAKQNIIQREDDARKEWKKAYVFEIKFQLFLFSYEILYLTKQII